MLLSETEATMIKLILIFHQPPSGSKVYPPLSFWSLNRKLDNFWNLSPQRFRLDRTEKLSCYMSGKRFPSKLIAPGCHRVFFSGNKPKEKRNDYLFVTIIPIKL